MVWDGKKKNFNESINQSINTTQTRIKMAANNK